MNKTDLKNKIVDLFIVKENDGSYNLFGKYTITNEKGLYVVRLVEDNVKNTFSSLKHAVTWCVFEKNNKQKEVRRIAELDDILGSLDAIILQHTKMLQKTNDSSSKSIIYAKLFEERLKKRQALQEIEKYATISRHLQNKKFAENTLKS